MFNYLQSDWNIALGLDLSIVLSCAVETTVDTQCCEDRHAHLRSTLVFPIADPDMNSTNPSKYCEAVIPSKSFLNAHSAIHSEST
jgi:hypothetical protein